jgi:hypothetical protein
MTADVKADAEEVSAAISKCGYPYQKAKLVADAYLAMQPVMVKMLAALKAFVEGVECEDAGSNDKDLFAYFYRAAWLRMKRDANVAIAEAEKLV